MLREIPNINLKKSDKGTRTVALNAVNKICVGQIQLDNLEHYELLEHSMFVETSLRVQQLVKELHQHNYIDDMTNSGFVKHLTCFAHQCSPHLQKFTNQP